MLARVPWTPTLKATPKPKRLNKDKHRHLVETVAAVLKSGEPTHFAFEASCRHGIRSSLCLQGWGWQEADATAADIVATALNRIGARRPTWQQGQPGWTEEGVLRHERTHCARCRTPIPEERNSGGTPAKYCSMVCTNAAKDAAWYARQGEEGRARHAVSEAARLAKKRAAMPAKPCAYCAGMFRPMPATGKRPESIFCSPRCRNKARSKFYDAEKGTIVHKASRWQKGRQTSAFTCGGAE